MATIWKSPLLILFIALVSQQLVTAQQDGNSRGYFRSYLRPNSDEPDQEKLQQERVSEVRLVETAEELRYMWDDQLDAIFRRGTISLGLPEGYHLGFSMLRGALRAAQPAANGLWDGKYFVTVKGVNCQGDCGQTGLVSNLEGRSQRKAGNGMTHFGKMRDYSPACQRHEADDKKSIIVDYYSQATGLGMGDELRLVNSEKKIYLGRGCASGMFLGYFVVTFDHY